MAEISITGPHEGEVALSGPVQMRILEDGSTTSHRLGLGEITIAPHTDGPPQHRHARHDEGFYVVSGTARFTVGDASYDAPAGTLVMVPPGAPHTFGNATGEPAVLLNTFTPDLYVQYFRDLRDMIAAGQPMTPAAVVDVMGRYATVPATDYASPAAATRTVTADGIGAADVSYTDRGAGPVFLLLHGGAGPQSVTGFADLLAGSGPARVIVPVHPGFGGTPRPDGLNTIAGLARLYAALLDELGLDAVTVIGNSVGGWIAAEMAVAGSARIAGLVLVDAVGIEVPGHPVADFFSLTLDQVAELSYHHPAAFRINPAAMSEEQRRVMAGNREALAVYAGTDMSQKGLNERLRQIKVPTCVLWGASDRIVDPEYGLAYATAIPGAEFRMLPDTGHVPQLETPAPLAAAILGFTAGISGPRRSEMAGRADGGR
jgi:pimeloyl-ACP methyl ester carboxylesterase/mannose-6-phosphate isomerase-like protein (cupin superfamily)